MDAPDAVGRQRTPEHLLRTAERLFAEQGIDAVSLRQVVTAAGHRNPAAVQYYFGSKEGLIEAIIEHRLPPINQRRLELLTERPTDGTDELERVMRAVIVPLVELDLVGGYYIRFLAALASHPADIVRAFDGVQGDVGLSGRLVGARLRQALPSHSEQVHQLRVSMAMRLVLATLAARQHDLAQGVDQGIDQDKFTEELVAATVGLLAAPSRGTTTRSPRRTPGKRNQS